MVVVLRQIYEIAVGLIAEPPFFILDIIIYHPNSQGTFYFSSQLNGHIFSRSELNVVPLNQPFRVGFLYDTRDAKYIYSLLTNIFPPSVLPRRHLLHMARIYQSFLTFCFPIHY